MKVVSVINYKGGVGKTTVVANLAAYAASKGSRVLMIDVDPNASLTNSFIPPEKLSDSYSKRNIKNFFNAIIDNKKIGLSNFIISLSLKLNDGNSFTLGLINSNSDLPNIDVKLGAIIQDSPTHSMRAENSLKHYSHLLYELKELKNNYDLVLIDCPPNFHSVVKNAITASDYCLIPAKMDYLSAEGVKNTKDNIHNHILEYRKYIEMFEKSEYSPLKAVIMGIVPMMLTIYQDKPIQINQEYIDKLQNDFYVFPFIRNNATIFGSIKAPSIPVVLSCPRAGNYTLWQIVKSELEALGNDFIKQVFNEV